MPNFYKRWDVYISLIVVFLLSSCSGTAINSATAVNTTQVNKSEQILQAALNRLQTSKSYTVNLTKSIGSRIINIYDPSNTNKPTTNITDDNISSTIQCQVDNTNQVARVNSSNSSGDFTRVYSAGRWYVLDATGLLKPSDAVIWTEINKYCEPLDSELNIDIFSLPTEDYQYEGKDTVNDQPVFKYSVTIPETTLENSKKQLSSENISYTDLEITNPEYMIYVDQTTYAIVKISITMDKMVTKYTRLDGTEGNYSEFSNSQFVQTAEYSNWGATTPTIDGLVDTGDSSLQTYSGKFSDYITFEFPKVDRLSDSTSDNFYISISDLKGDTVAMMEQPTWYFTDETLCANYADTVLLDYLKGTDSSATIESAKLQTQNGINICKIVAITGGKASVQYLFTEPDSVAKARGHSVNTTINIWVSQADGQDPRDLFSDIFDTIQFVQ